jgi:glycerophosphoryl diester phosphodiesterase
MSHHKIVIAFLALLLLAVTSLPANEGIRVRWNIRDHVDCADVSVCVHRGAGDLAPENALPSLLFTWELQGCNGIPEVDIRTTKDGILAMFHDGDFRRILPDARKK